MGLLGIFSRPQRTDSVFGELVYRHGSWQGKAVVPNLISEPVPLALVADKKDNLSPFHTIWKGILGAVEALKEQIAQAAFETYRRYVRQDLERGNFVESDYLEYPSVSCVADVWKVFTPIDVTLTLKEPEFNAVFSFDVYWPNPHMFEAYFLDDKLHLLDAAG